MASDDCKHEVCTRDISNMATCIACGKELGPAFSEFDPPYPTGPYMGINRTESFKPAPPKEQ